MHDHPFQFRDRLVLCLTLRVQGMGTLVATSLVRILDSQLDHPTCGDLGVEGSMKNSSGVLDRLYSTEMPSLVANKLKADPS